jgi:hypothetical protein
MAVAAEKLSGDYIEPPWSAFEPLTNGEREMEGYRLAETIGRVSIFEPLQPGVRRYPPVAVEVGRSAAKVSEYVNMPPTDWSEVFFRPKKDTESSDAGGANG